MQPSLLLRFRAAPDESLVTHDIQTPNKNTAVAAQFKAARGGPEAGVTTVH